MLKLWLLWLEIECCHLKVKEKENKSILINIWCWFWNCSLRQQTIRNIFCFESIPLMLCTHRQQQANCLFGFSTVHLTMSCGNSVSIHFRWCLKSRLDSCWLVREANKDRRRKREWFSVGDLTWKDDWAYEKRFGLRVCVCLTIGLLTIRQIHNNKERERVRVRAREKTVVRIRNGVHLNQFTALDNRVYSLTKQNYGLLQSFAVFQRHQKQ